MKKNANFDCFNAWFQRRYGREGCLYEPDLGKSTALNGIWRAASVIEGVRLLGRTVYLADDLPGPNSILYLLADLANGDPAGRSGLKLRLKPLPPKTDLLHQKAGCLVVFSGQAQVSLAIKWAMVYANRREPSLPVILFAGGDSWLKEDFQAGGIEADQVIFFGQPPNNSADPVDRAFQRAGTITGLIGLAELLGLAIVGLSLNQFPIAPEIRAED